MKKPDIILTDINGIIRVTFNTDAAKKLAIDEPEFAPYVNRKDGFIYIDIKKSTLNRNNMIAYCVSHSLTSITEKEEK